MAGLSARMAPVASRLITKYGALMTITRRYDGTFDPVSQTQTRGQVLTDNLSCVLTDYRSSEVNGDTIRYGDKKVLIPRSDLTNLLKPATDDTINVLGQTFRVVDVVGVSAGDDNIAYSVQVRK